MSWFTLYLPTRLEYMLAIRYLRASKAQGGVAIMTVISFLGIALSVFALIATLAVRAGFRYEFVQTIIGANAHVQVYAEIPDHAGVSFASIASDLLRVPDVITAAPTIRRQALISHQNSNAGIEAFGLSPQALAALPRIADTETALGELASVRDGNIAIGIGVARTLGVILGDNVRILSPSGVKTPFGVAPRVHVYKVAYIFQAGRYDIDNTRVYMSFADAERFFNTNGQADYIALTTFDPERVDALLPRLQNAAPVPLQFWTWRDAAGHFLRALTVEDNVMFVVMSIVVLIAAMNIVSGLIMLVKNKTADIAILRTMGLSQKSILHVFMLCGGMISLSATLLGVAMGCLFALYIDPIFNAIEVFFGNGVWDESVRGIYALPARLQLADIAQAVFLSLLLSGLASYLPAQRAARKHPVEALRAG